MPGSGIGHIAVIGTGTVGANWAAFARPLGFRQRYGAAGGGHCGSSSARPGRPCGS